MSATDSESVVLIESLVKHDPASDVEAVDGIDLRVHLWSLSARDCGRHRRPMYCTCTPAAFLSAMLVLLTIPGTATLRVFLRWVTM